MQHYQTQIKEKKNQHKIIIYFIWKNLQHLRRKKERKTSNINVDNMASIREMPAENETSQEDLNYKNKLTAKLTHRD